MSEAIAVETRTLKNRTQTAEDDLIAGSIRDLIHRWLEDKGCPGGTYVVEFRSKVTCDGHTPPIGKPSHVWYAGGVDVKVKPGDNNSCRQVRIYPPRRMRAATLLSHLTMTLEYAEGSQMVQNIYDMILQALQHANCTGSYVLNIRRQHSKYVMNNTIVLADIRDEELTLTCKPAGKLAYVCGLSGPKLEETMSQLVASGRATMLADCLDFTHEMERQRHQRISEAANSMVEANARGAVCTTLFDIMMEESFPLVSRKRVRELLANRCRMFQVVNAFSLISAYLEADGKTFRLRENAYQLLEEDIADGRLLGTEELMAELAERASEAFAEAERLEQEHVSRQEAANGVISSLEAQIASLEAELRSARSRLEEARREQANSEVASDELLAYREVSQRAASLFRLIKAKQRDIAV